MRLKSIIFKVVAYVSNSHSSRCGARLPDTTSVRGVDFLARPKLYRSVRIRSKFVSSRRRDAGVETR